MNEAYLKRKLVDAVKAAMPRAVVIRHEDKFTAGVPDLSVTWRGTTSWIEVKYKTGRTTKLQDKCLRDFGGNGVPAYVLTYRETWTELVEVNGHGDFLTCAGFGHGDVASFIKETHLDRQVVKDDALVAAFMTKFGVPAHAEPTWDCEVASRRLKHLFEEVTELHGATTANDFPAYVDALVDLVYVAIGAARELGVPWEEVFRAVHAANMEKVRVVGSDGHKLGIKKPEGWQAPDIAGVLINAGWEGR